MESLILFSVVSTNTTVYEIEFALVCHGIFPHRRNKFSFLSMNGFQGVRLNHSDTMGNLLAGPLTHFLINCLLLGGSGMTLMISCVIHLRPILYIPVGAGEAVDETGKLKDARDITWYYDKDDTVPIASGSRMFNSLIFLCLFFNFF